VSVCPSAGAGHGFLREKVGRNTPASPDSCCIAIEFEVEQNKPVTTELPRLTQKTKKAQSMSDSATNPSKPRPEFRNINAFKDLPSYRLPLAGVVSILHRISGLIMFLLLPFIIWMFDTSLSSEISFAKFRAAFSVGLLGLPGALWKLVALALIWAYLHHLVAGLRHLWMDMSHKATSKEFGKKSAVATFIVSLPIAAALGAKLFGLY
jgi:succinate dehydrogenase / fumarate reductase, cytochrome b subunit